MHKFFISFNLILCAIVSVVSIIPPVQEGKCCKLQAASTLCVLDICSHIKTIKNGGLDFYLDICNRNFSESVSV